MDATTPPRGGVLPERILCAAVWVRGPMTGTSTNPFAPAVTPSLAAGRSNSSITPGVVLAGHRHPYLLDVAAEGWPGVRIAQADQGFLTSRNRFVGRVEAMDIAIAAKQIERGRPGDNLYSEDLY